MTGKAHRFTGPARYHRQMLLDGFGEAGQQRLRESTALVVGCGALGSAVAESLARAGIGRLRLIDRDLVELTNLQRQVLFDERDVAEHLPKAEAARRRLQQINRDVEIEAHVADFNAGNANSLAADVDLVLDGLDNFETRYLLNDLAVRDGLPYLYAGAVGVTGMSLTILPHDDQRRGTGARRIAWSEAEATPCLRCLFPEPPAPGSTPTCDTAGVLAMAVQFAAQRQATEAIKLMLGRLDLLDRTLFSFDLWRNTWHRLHVEDAWQPASCPCCGQGRFTALDGDESGGTTTVCGRLAVQVNPPPGERVSDAEFLSRLAARLAPHGTFQTTPFLIRGTLDTIEHQNGTALIGLTVFADGRAIIEGTDDAGQARSIYARYVGS